jgi:hypothetical protein
MYCGISAALVPLTNEIVFAYQINLFQYHYHAFLTSLLPIYCNKYRFLFTLSIEFIKVKSF